MTMSNIRLSHKLRRSFTSQHSHVYATWELSKYIKQTINVFGKFCLTQIFKLP